MTVVLLVPVKRLQSAKSRLRPDLGAATPDLAMAMALDVVGAGTACAAIDRVLLLTDDPLVAAAPPDGVEIVPDAAGYGLNAALRAAGETVRAADPDSVLISQPADCPAVRAQDFVALLEQVRYHGRTFVSDALGTGTTALAAAPGQQLDPRYGPGSRARHRHAGAVELSGGSWRYLARDIDTISDLEALRDLGAGPHTQGWLRRHAATPWWSQPRWSVPS